MDRLNNLIVERHLTNYRVAKELGFTEAAIRSWRKGRTEPRGKNLHKIASFLHVDPAWLLYGDNKYTPALDSEAMMLAEEITKYGTGAVVKTRQMLKIFFEDNKKAQRKKIA